MVTLRILSVAHISLFTFATVHETKAAPASINLSQQVAVNPFQDIPVLINGVAGTLDITGFIVRNGQLVAVGNLVGGAINSIVQIPVTNIAGTCDILHLELGPVDLDLLGLVVHLDQVVLDINGQAAPGNLLGNLLCAMTHLLDNPSSSLNGVATLLNRILAIF